jgi:hypothetical protein
MSQGHHLHRTTQTRETATGTHDPIVLAGEEISYRRPLCHRDGGRVLKLSQADDPE